MIWIKKDSRGDRGKIVNLTGEKVTLRVDKKLIEQSIHYDFLKENNYLEKYMLNNTNAKDVHGPKESLQM